MERCLLISSLNHRQDSLESILNTAFSLVQTLDNATEARRILLEQDFDMIVIDTPLKDEFGHMLSIYAARNPLTSVILAVKNDRVDEMCEKVQEYGVMVLTKPIDERIFIQTLNLMKAARYRMAVLKKENDDLQSKIEEIKLVDKAKCILIERFQYTEQAAHRAIEKKAMDRRMSRKEIARMIVKNSEKGRVG